MKKRIGILAAVCLVLCSVFSGCAVIQGINGGLSTISYDYEDQYKMGDANAFDPTQIKNIEVNWVSGSIDIHEEDNLKEILLTENAKDLKDDYKLRYLVIDDTLYVQFAKSGKWNFHGVDKRLQISVPKGFELNKLKLNIVSASVNCKGVNIDKFDSDSVSGTIDLEADKFGAINMNTVSGSIDVRGAIERSFDSDAVSADVTLNLPEGTGFSASLNTTSGTFSSDFEYTGEKKNYKSGDGKLDIDCDSVSGRLKVNKLK